MDANEKIEKQFEQAEKLSRRIAEELVSQNPRVIAVALIGGWARGIVSAKDMDFLVIVRDSEHLQHASRQLKQFEQGLRTKHTFFLYTVAHVAKLVRQRGSTVNLTRFARRITRALRRVPQLKKLLIMILGPKRTFFQLYEVLPQSFQTAIPLYDKNGVLSRFQEEQKAKLEGRLSYWEKQFYSPRGFHKLITGYFSEDVDMKIVRSILEKSDIDGETYLRRLAEFYDLETNTRKAELYRQLIQ